MPACSGRSAASARRARRVAANPSLAKTPDLDGWLSIGSNGRVTVCTGKVDIGQRISTALALIVAEELDVDYGRIDVARPEQGQAPDRKSGGEGKGRSVRVNLGVHRTLKKKE